MTFQLAFPVRASTAKNGVLSNLNRILYIYITVLLFYINTYVDLSTMIIKHEYTLEKFVTVSCSYGNWSISIVRSGVLLVDHSEVNV